MTYFLGYANKQVFMYYLRPKIKELV
jgi:hypothetical protein